MFGSGVRSGRGWSPSPLLGIPLEWLYVLGKPRGSSRSLRSKDETKVFNWETHISFRVPKTIPVFLKHTKQAQTALAFLAGDVELRLSGDRASLRDYGDFMETHSIWSAMP